MKKWVNFNCHTDEAERPKYRKSEDFYLGCHCEECGSTTKQSTLSKWIATLVSLARNDVKRVAFTLAEVLITLVIIGVIAALTIPNLMQKWGDHADVVKVKEAYSILSNAIKMAIAENGPLDEWNWPAPNGYYSESNCVYFRNQLLKYLKVDASCKEDKECVRYGYNNVNFAYTTKGSKSTNYAAKGFYGGYHHNIQGTSAILLQNGMVIKIDSSNIFVNNKPTGGRTTFVSIIVDINGVQKPTRWGYDVFSFGVAVNGLEGRNNHEWIYHGASGCSFAVNQGTYDGVSCADWVLRKGNMDYKYRDVSAEW